MSKQLTFNDAKEKYFNRLKQYVQVVARVHGGNHPEFYVVQELYDAIAKKSKDTEAKKPSLDDEFVKLREVTDNYIVPSDVCESYEAVYNMLAELDKAYHH